MGILKRFSDIMSANMNALLDKAEDPAKMIDQYLRNLESDLGKVKAETAAIMAEETRAKRELDECSEQVDKMQAYAEKAVLADNDTDAKLFLTKKAQYVQKQSELQRVYDAAKANADKMKSMHDKLLGDINDLNARKDAIKAKVAVAKTQEKLNQIGSSLQGANNSLSAFDRMEDKANRMLDEANAMAQLNQTKEDDTIELMNKYDSQGDTVVEDELAALKAKMGR
ncbi:PspA/IM30 family protein [Candidatus Galacturonibacter soehngenii]|uniref:PspA/IM30 family protein n=1 Tax=Candidatus Galacturonatibacter soehngenii TaxID=2307010 RepID=A0A7V7UCJ7_9FIRM|nr:PspA/IM30 family protein [Candidatus Galacturonibacter soehngenii]KAB1438739.1 PspA/IM30 family protein [Candidatus Galacturonibacter soehngenii]